MRKARLSRRFPERDADEHCSSAHIHVRGKLSERIPKRQSRHNKERSSVVGFLFPQEELPNSTRQKPYLLRSVFLPGLHTHNGQFIFSSS